MVSVLSVSGMTAVHARRAVFTALAGVPGVTEADVSLGKVVVVHDDGVDVAAITAAIETVGCSVTSIEQRSRRVLPLRGDGPDHEEG